MEVGFRFLQFQVATFDRQHIADDNIGCLLSENLSFVYLGVLFGCVSFRRQTTQTKSIAFVVLFFHNRPCVRATYFTTYDTGREVNS